MSYRILIVEDETIWRDMLTEFFGRLLREREHELLYARTFREAIDVVDRESEIDLAIVDVNLTGGERNRDGIAFIGYLGRKGQIIPVIIVSGTIPAEEISFTGGYVKRFIEKPFKFAEFKEKVSEVLLSDSKEEEGVLSS